MTRPSPSFTQFYPTDNRAETGTLQHACVRTPQQTPHNPQRSCRGRVLQRDKAVKKNQTGDISFRNQFACCHCQLAAITGANAVA